MESKRKTAMMELIEILKKSANDISDTTSGAKLYRAGLREAILEAEYLLEKEKEQIMRDYVTGRERLKGDSPARYYYETYKHETK